MSIKSRMYEPGDQINSLYELKPAITCPICDKKAKARIYPRIHNQEGAVLTTTELNVYQLSNQIAMPMHCFAIDIHTGEIEVSVQNRDGNKKHLGNYDSIKLVEKELSPSLEIVMSYCENKCEIWPGSFYRYPDWSKYAHYYETLFLEIDYQKLTVTKISLFKFGLMNRINNQYVSIEVDSSSSDIRKDLRSGIDIENCVSARFQSVSVDKAAELIKTTKYMNLL